MPFFKRRRFARRSYGTGFKRRFPRRKSRVYKTAKRAAKRVIRQQAETKHKDQDFATINTTTSTHGQFPVDFPTQGSGAVQRIGAAVDLRRITINFHHTFQAAAVVSPDTSYFIRLTVLQWHPTINILAPPFNSSNIYSQTGDDSFLSTFEWNRSQSKDYTILYDRRYCMGDSWRENAQIALNINIAGMKKFRHRITWDKATDDSYSNSIWLIWSTNAQNAEGGNALAAGWQTRITFKDV